MAKSKIPGWMRTREDLKSKLDPNVCSYANHYLQSDALTRIWHRAGKRLGRQVRISVRAMRQGSRVRELRRQYGAKR